MKREGDKEKGEEEGKEEKGKEREEFCAVVIFQEKPCLLGYDTFR